jgi:hypothetical protein
MERRQSLGIGDRRVSTSCASSVPGFWLMLKVAGIYVAKTILDLTR